MKNRRKITKAAAISSAMLARKQSFKARESFGILADLLADETQEISDINWFDKRIPHVVLIIACFASLVSVSINTPQMFINCKELIYITFGVDLAVTLLFTVEAASKMKNKGIMKKTKGYMRDKWCQFDFFMLACHWLSIVAQVIQMSQFDPANKTVENDRTGKLGLIRSPRPLIMVRLIRSLFKVQLPRNRISQVIKRSGQQVKNVTIFFSFFMSLYSILGVQFFGRMDYHCVRNDSDPNNITIDDLAIPDTFCIKNSTENCPDGMKCEKLRLNASDEGYYGMFNNFVYSIFSVYMAASQEGWVYVMYDCIDSLPPWRSFFYFTTLIFFLAWLVKNVFIAVITETFAEIRVQFSQMWGNRELLTEEEVRQILEKGEDGWRLVALDENTYEGWAPKICQRFQRSMPFQVTVMIIILANAFFAASIVHKHDGTDDERKLWYYYVECGFTLIFNLECLFKIWCLGWKSYAKRALHKFELTLCIGSSLNVIKPFYDKNLFTFFQVFRIVRLTKASPMLEDFVYKIFGPGKKLGSLVFFTMALLLLTSSISLQLFCFVYKLEKFRTLREALMAMFQIMTQEGWTDVVVETMRACDSLAPAVAIYFVAYHLFVTLIVLSLFVAVILDNLEMEEEMKKVKQLKAREQTTSSRTKLPLRLRIFSKFPERPQMVIVKRIGGEFQLPKIRDTFTKIYADNDEEAEEGQEGKKEKGKNAKLLSNRSRLYRTKRRTKMRKIGQIVNRTAITDVLEHSNKTRVLLSDSAGILPTISRFGLSKIYRDGRKFAIKKSLATRGLNSSVKVKQMYEHLKENGDLSRPTDSAEKKDMKQGEIDFKAIQQKKQQAEITRSRLEEEMKENHPFFDRPLFVLRRDNRFRKLCQLIVYSKYEPTKTDPTTGKPIQRKYKGFHDLISMMTYLEWIMFFITCISCVSMMFETPWPTDASRLIMNSEILKVTEYIFVTAMSMELMLKVLANGLFFTPKALIRDFGGILTVFIYVTSLLFLIWMPKKIEVHSGAMFLMICRCMRPLRIYTLVPHIRRVVVELCRGFKEILLVTVLLVLLMFIFASYGVQIAGGKLAKCNDPKIQTREECVGEFIQYVHVTKLNVPQKDDIQAQPRFLVPRVWINPRNCNFDHIGNAMLALFEILSFKMWTVVRDVIIDRLGTMAAVVIHVYVFIGCLIGLTLFVGVVIANYSENRGTALLTVDQRRWNDLKNRLKMAQPLHIPPKPPESAKTRLFLYRLTMSTYFKRFFSICVILNSALLAIPWSSEEEMTESKETLQALVALCAILTLLFALEVIFKIVAYTPRGFLQSRRNKIDFIITGLGIAWCILHFAIALPANKIKDETYTFGYIIVVLRFFTIAARHSTLKMLMLTVLMSMFRSFFIIMAMFLLMLFYAYAGVILFGMVKYGQAVGRHANFRTPMNALTVLFRIVTGEDWNEVMHDCMRHVPYCTFSEGVDFWKTDCGNYYGAIIFFCSFYLIITYIVLNLLVAIIMENFSLFYSSEEDALLSYADIRNFQSVWNIVDLEQKGDIPVARVKFLLRLLKGRLEVDPEKDRLLFKHMCYEMERLHNGEEVSFHDVLIMLSYRSVDIRKHLQLEELIQREELEYIIEEEVAKQTIRSWLESCLRKMRQKEQSMSIINSLRATNDAINSVVTDSTTAPETLRTDEQREDRVRKKAALLTKSSGLGGRRGSVSGVVVEAAKKFLKAAEKPDSKLAPSSARRTMKISGGSKNLPEVTEGNEELQQEKTSINSTASMVPSPDITLRDASPTMTIAAAGSGAGAAGPMTPGIGANGHVADNSTFVPDIRIWWTDAY